MLIRKSVYGFRISIKESINTILQNIVGSSDIIMHTPIAPAVEANLYAHASRKTVLLIFQPTHFIVHLL